ncbi:MAG: tetratricopeptide repeat protein [Bacteroidales bacterium]
MKKIFLAFAGLLFSFQMIAANDTQLVAKGNKAYMNGMFSQAIACYQDVLKRGSASAELYYNLGNAYYKTDDLPSAILYYEKAKKLHPNDADINFNLSVANNKIADKIEQVPQLFIKRWWTAVFNLFSLETLATASIVLFTLFLLLISIFLFARPIWVRKVTFWCGIGILGVSISAFVIAQRKHHALKEQKEAIVFTPAVTVKSSPDANSVDLFVVHEGAKVIILDTLATWQEIRIGNGSEGWIKAIDTRRI